MFSISSLEQRSFDLQKEIINLEEQLRAISLVCGNERLVARNAKNGTYKYYASSPTDDGKILERYLGKTNTHHATNLAMRDYLKVRLKEAVLEKKTIDKLLKYMHGQSHINNYLSTHPGHAELINEQLKKEGVGNLRKEDREIFDLVEKWKNLPYQRSQNHPENLKISTIVPGLNVRSKSEALMVSLFEAKHVAYHYEEILIGTDEYGRHIIIAPDFTCKNMRLNQIKIVEHLGKCDDMDYMHDFGRRVEIYHRAGYHLGQNLFITTETKDSPLDINSVNALIDHWLL